MSFWGSGKNEKKKFEIGDRVESAERLVML